MKPFLLEGLGPARVVWHDGDFFLKDAGDFLFNRFHWFLFPRPQTVAWERPGISKPLKCNWESSSFSPALDLEHDLSRDNLLEGFDEERVFSAQDSRGECLRRVGRLNGNMCLCDDRPCVILRID